MTDDDALVGKHIVITRPEHQAQPLATLITQQGGTATILPAMQIQPIQNSHIQSQITKIQPNDFAIYISANAVNCSQLLWSKQPPKLTVIAIGPGTANALEQHGITADVIPKQFNSNGILDLNILQTPMDNAVHIFCGENSKPLLYETLLERGFDVQQICCYQRCCPDKITDSQFDLLNQQSIDAIISTSSESLTNLVQMFSPKHLNWLLQQRLVVISQHMHKIAKDLGFSSSISVSDNATDIEINKTLTDLDFLANSAR